MSINPSIRRSLSPGEVPADRWWVAVVVDDPTVAGVRDNIKLALHDDSGLRPYAYIGGPRLRHHDSISIVSNIHWSHGIIWRIGHFFASIFPTHVLFNGFIIIIF